MRIITLTTDFGLTAEYVAVMKGVILGIAPHARLIDVCHSIKPQNIEEAAYILRRTTPYFPQDTIHLVVVDPGVGSQRRPILVKTQPALYVGPDNGVFTSAYNLPETQVWHLDKSQFWLPNISRTFHGRDIFAPVAAHLANEEPPTRLGSPITDPVRLALPLPARRADGSICGTVIYVDTFGNLISDIPAAWITTGQWCCELAGHGIGPICNSYAEVAPGELLALVSSGGTLEVAARDGNAALKLDAQIGNQVILHPAN